MKVATSILSADFNNLEKVIKSIETSDFIHLDVMDGHFVPNISFGYPVLRNLKKITKVPLDTHLMVTNPLEYIDDFAKIGSEIITIHIESKAPYKTLDYIKDKGIKAGISLKPKTDMKDLIPFLQIVDLILVMTVEPGFGGQAFMEEQLEKVKYLSMLREKHGYKYLIQIDGGVNDKTIKKARDIGVDIVVSGSYILDHENQKEAIESLR